MAVEQLNEKNNYIRKQVREYKYNEALIRDAIEREKFCKENCTQMCLRLIKTG